MAVLDLFRVASIPVLKVLLLSALGSYLSLDHVDILGENARNQLNNVVFYVFNPALVTSNLAKTVTFESFVLLWFMPLNILLTFIIGSALGWILIITTKPPQHLKGLILGSCSAGNLGNLPMIIIPTICKEKGSPFGDPNVCYTYGMAYASLSMAIGAIYIWSYVYNIVRVTSTKMTGEYINIDNSDIDIVKSTGETKTVQGNCSVSKKVKLHLAKFSRRINMRVLFAPSTTGAIAGFIIGTVAPIRNLLIGDTAPLRVLQDSASLLADATIPTVTLIIGGNLLRGLKGSGIQISIIVGIVGVRYVLLPLFGILIVKGAIHYGMVHSDPLYQFVLLLQFALPPAMNIGTMTQLFGAGQNECSIILLWTYSLASVSLSVWSTFFMWLVA